MKKIFIVFIIMLLVCLFTSCKGKKREITLISLNDREVLTMKIGEELVLEEKIYDGFLFTGWVDSLGNPVQKIVVSDNATFTASYIKYGTTWNITYDLNGGEFVNDAPIVYETGKKLKLSTPVGEGNMIFLGWYLNDEYITEIPYNYYWDVHLVAKWNDLNVYHNISYNLDEKVSMPEEVITKFIEGYEYTLPVPKKEGYFFRGWYKETDFNTRVRKVDETIKEDLNLYPLWVEKTKENTYVSFLGDSITTYAEIIPEGFPTYYPCGDVNDISKTWWNIALNQAKLNLLMNNSYSGSYVSQGDMYGASEQRIALLSKDNIDPDVVVIYMGTNDLTHNIKLTKFETMYTKMIERIKTIYDDVMIFVVTMPFNKYSTSFNAPRNEMNNAIINIATTYGLFVIDLVPLITFDNAYDYMYAGAHPNAAGMKVIGDEVGKHLKREFK